MRRGEVWSADLPPSTGRRPAVLLSRDEAYSSRELVTITPITTRVRGVPSEVPLDPKEGLPRDCAVALDSIGTISKNRLQPHVASLPTEKLHAVAGAMHFALDLEW